LYKIDALSAGEGFYVLSKLEKRGIVTKTFR